MIRTFISRVTAPLRRSKPCGCAYPAGWKNDGVPQAHRVNDGVTDDGQFYIEYYCHLCKNRFKQFEGSFDE